MIFMRPKLILIVFQSTNEEERKKTTTEIQRFLRRVGYIGGWHVEKVNQVVYVWGIRTNLLEYK